MVEVSVEAEKPQKSIFLDLSKILDLSIFLDFSIFRKQSWLSEFFTKKSKFPLDSILLIVYCSFSSGMLERERGGYGTNNLQLSISADLHNG